MMENPAQTGLPFMKMHGLGNDFVVIDARTTDVSMTAPLAAALAAAEAAAAAELGDDSA